jgi:hypothetical protein
MIGKRVVVLPALLATMAGAASCTYKKKELSVVAVDGAIVATVSKVERKKLTVGVAGHGSVALPYPTTEVESSCELHVTKPTEFTDSDGPACFGAKLHADDTGMRLVWGAIRANRVVYFGKAKRMFAAPLKQEAKDPIEWEQVPSLQELLPELLRAGIQSASQRKKDEASVRGKDLDVLKEMVERGDFAVLERVVLETRDAPFYVEYPAQEGFDYVGPLKVIGNLAKDLVFGRRDAGEPTVDAATTDAQVSEANPNPTPEPKYLWDQALSALPVDARDRVRVALFGDLEKPRLARAVLARALRENDLADVRHDPVLFERARELVEAAKLERSGEKVLAVLLRRLAQTNLERTSALACTFMTKKESAGDMDEAQSAAMLVLSAANKPCPALTKVFEVHASCESEQWYCPREALPMRASRTLCTPAEQRARAIALVNTPWATLHDTMGVEQDLQGQALASVQPLVGPMPKFELLLARQSYRWSTPKNARRCAEAARGEVCDISSELVPRARLCEPKSVVEINEHCALHVDDAKRERWFESTVDHADAGAGAGTEAPSGSRHRHRHRHH